jgi:hypothetical protein
MRKRTIFGNAMECFHMFLAEVEFELFTAHTFPRGRSVVASPKFGQAF